MLVKCDECGKMAKKTPGQIKKYKRHFCDKACYISYMRKHPRAVYCNGINKKPFEKIKMLAELRRKMYA